MKINKKFQKFLWAVLAVVGAYAFLISYMTKPNLLAILAAILLLGIALVNFRQSVLANFGKKKAPAKKPAAPAKK